MSVNYNKIAKPDTFIGRFMLHMSNHETASAYDFWSAIFAIGVTCGRDVYVDRPVGHVFLNHYIIFCAESGATRKSTAIKAIGGVLDQCPHILEGRTSPQKLDALLHEHSEREDHASAAFVVSELVTVLGREGYMAGMPGLLTDLYDCPSLRRPGGTLGDGKMEQRNVYVNLLSASTPTWLVTAINPSVIEGGFTSRVLFITGEKRKRAIAWQAKNPNEISIEQTKRVLEDICKQAAEIGGIGINKGGLTVYEKWYKNRSQHRDAFQASFEAREDDHVLKLACCLCINDKTFQIGAVHVKNAIQIIEHLKESASHMFGDAVTVEARMGAAVTKLRELLVKAGDQGRSKTQIATALRAKLDRTEIDVLLQIMHEAGFIQHFVIKPKTGRPKSIYRATDAIRSFSLTNDVLGRLNLAPN